MAEPETKQTRTQRLEGDTTVFTIVYEDNEIEFLEKDEPTAPEEDVKEIVEHVCGRCTRSYTTYYTLWNHMRTCKEGTQKMIIQENYDELTLDQIKGLEKSAGRLASKNICYCCEENLETAHTGHIRCQDCPKSFKTVNSFQRHVSFVHSSITLFPCDTCNAKCPTSTILEIHKTAHKLGKPFACQKCGKDFTRRYHLQRHQQHSKCDPDQAKPMLKCNVCGKDFYRVDNLRTHLRSHIETDTKSRDYQCPYCDKAFISTTTLNIHVRTHTGERPFTCDLCQRGFPSNGALRKHRRSHTGEKPYKCSVCEKAFAAKEVLNRHMKTHTGVKPHVCTTCGKGFIQATQLKAHMFNHSGTNGFPCSRCGMQFNRNQKLKDHVENYHAGDESVFDCCACDVVFNNKDDLKDHMEQHSLKKLYKCRCCKKKFGGIEKHPSCSLCAICSKNDEDNDETSPHEHVPKKMRPMVMQVTKEIVEFGETEDEPPSKLRVRKIKIFTSKVAKDENDDDEVISENADQTESVIEDDYSAIKEDVDENTVIPLFPLKKETEEETYYETQEGIDAIPETTGTSMDKWLIESVGKLLNLLLDQEMLTGFGWPTAPVEDVLSSVITQCGHEPANFDSCSDYSTVIRENIKLLFTVVVDNASFKSLLNNHTIDEVVQQILQMTSTS